MKMKRNCMGGLFYLISVIIDIQKGEGLAEASPA
jgi:hypothetical protein